MKKGKAAGLLILYVTIFFLVICLQTYALRHHGTWVPVDIITVGIAVAGGLIFWILLKNDAVGQCKEESTDERRKTVTKEEYIATAKGKGLTKRELELGFLILSGYSNREIAQELYISEATVKKHASHIYEKMKVQSRKEFRSLFS